MADKKITQLPPGGPAQAGDQIPIARGGSNYRLTAAEIASLAAGGSSAPTSAQFASEVAARISGDNALSQRISALVLDSLANVSAPAPSSSQGLVFNSAAGQWVASTLAAGGASVTSAEYLSLVNRVSVNSAQMTSADNANSAAAAQADSVAHAASAAAAAASAAAAAVSADLTSLRSVVQANSAQMTSADNANSAAAAQADSVAHAASAAAAAVSADLTSVKAVVSNQGSAIIANSAQMTSADNANSAAAAQADSVAHAASAAAAAVSAAHTSLVDRVSANSAQMTSADNANSAAAAQADSVAHAASAAAAAASAAAAAVSAAHTSLAAVVSNQGSAIVANSAQMTSADNANSAAAAQADSVAHAASAAAAAASAAAAAVSANHTSLAAVVSNQGSAIVANSAQMTSANNALSQRISALVLDSLANVSAPTPTSGQVLAYNSAAAQWVASAMAGGAATHGASLHTGNIFPLSAANQFLGSAYFDFAGISASAINSVSAGHSRLYARTITLETSQNNRLYERGREADDQEILRDNSFIGRNTSGGAVTRGQLVYIAGASGAFHPQVRLALANSSTTMPAVGIVMDSVPDQFLCRVMTLGYLFQGIDTSAFSEGDNLYVSPTVAGALTNVIPAYPNIAQRVAIVATADPFNGTLHVCPSSEIVPQSVLSAIFSAISVNSAQMTSADNAISAAVAAVSADLTSFKNFESGNNAALSARIDSAETAGLASVAAAALSARVDSVAGQKAVLSGAQVVSGTALVSVSGLTFSVGAGNTYGFKFVIYQSAPISLAAPQFMLSAAAPEYLNAIAVNYLSTGAGFMTFLASVGNRWTGFTTVPNVGARRPMVLEGVYKASAGGTMNLNVGNAISAGAAGSSITIMPGSYGQVWRIV